MTGPTATGARPEPRHLLVVGAQRCGTTYLHDLLAAHPDVAMARPSRPEPKVFCSPDLSARGRAWYQRTYFGHAEGERVLGEKSTSYLEYADAAARAGVVLGAPLVLAQLRDPVQRAVSHWAFTTDGGLETRPLHAVLTANLEGPLPPDPAVRPVPTSVSPYAYLERGRYTDYLQPWVHRFGGDVILVLMEELVSEPDRVAEVYAALGVDPRFRPVGLGRPVNASAHRAPELEPALVARLRAYFGDSDAALERLLGRQVPWSARTGAVA